MVGINVERSFQKKILGDGYFQVSIMACTGRLLQKGVSFSGFRYMKEKGFHQLKYMKG